MSDIQNIWPEVRRDRLKKEIAPEHWPIGRAPIVNVICSRWNEEVNQLLIQGCQRQLDFLNVPQLSKERPTHPNSGFAWQLHRVNGCFEILHLAQCLLDGHFGKACLVCLGTIIKGDTEHDVHLSRAVIGGLAELSRQTPIGLGILTCNTQEQAIERADPERGDKGGESVLSALELFTMTHKPPKPN